MRLFRKKDTGSILWYASRNKLEALEAGSGPAIGSLSGKVDVGPASFELGIDRADPRIMGAVQRVDRRLRRSDSVMSVNEISKASPPSALFEFQGPCSRLAAEGAFWVAGLCDNVAVLLVGSLANATSGYRDEKTSELMRNASVDPLGSTLKLAARLAGVRLVDRLQGRKVEYDDSYLEGQHPVARMSALLHQRERVLADRAPDERDREITGHLDHTRRLYPQIASGAERLWVHILQSGLLDVEEGLGSLPIARGIATFGNRRSFKPRQDRYIEQQHLDLVRQLAPAVETIVIGSPVFVENIPAPSQAT